MKTFKMWISHSLFHLCQWRPPSQETATSKARARKGKFSKVREGEWLVTKCKGWNNTGTGGALEGGGGGCLRSLDQTSSISHRANQLPAPGRWVWIRSTAQGCCQLLPPGAQADPWLQALTAWKHRQRLAPLGLFSGPRLVSWAGWQAHHHGSCGLWTQLQDVQQCTT